MQHMMHVAQQRADIEEKEAVGAEQGKGYPDVILSCHFTFPRHSRDQSGVQVTWITEPQVCN